MHGAAAFEAAAAAWRASAAAADFLRAVALLPVGSTGTEVAQWLGQPLGVTPMSGGAQSWLYVRSDDALGQREALMLVFGAGGGYERLLRKPID